MRQLGRYLHQQWSRRKRVVTRIQRENDRLAATVTDDALAIAELTRERERLTLALEGMTHERDRAERFLREAREANVGAGVEIIRLKAVIALQTNLLESRAQELSELARELDGVRNSIDGGLAAMRHRLLSKGGHA